MNMQTWTLVIVALAVLTGLASGAAPPSPATVAPVGVQNAWLCVGPMGSFRESFEVPGSSLAVTAVGKPLVMVPTVKMLQPLDFHIASQDFRRCW